MEHTDITPIMPTLFFMALGVAAGNAPPLRHAAQKQQGLSIGASERTSSLAASELMGSATGWRGRVQESAPQTQDTQPDEGVAAIDDGELPEKGRRIIGGTYAMGGYRWTTQMKWSWGICTGELVTDKWMLTAAHCVLNKQKNGFTSVAEQDMVIKYGCLTVLDSRCITVYFHPGAWGRVHVG